MSASIAVTSAAARARSGDPATRVSRISRQCTSRSPLCGAREARGEAPTGAECAADVVGELLAVAELDLRVPDPLAQVVAHHRVIGEDAGRRRRAPANAVRSTYSSSIPSLCVISCAYVVGVSGMTYQLAASISPCPRCTAMLKCAPELTHLTWTRSKCCDWLARGELFQRLLEPVVSEGLVVERRHLDPTG
jgi:hypothetical protein